ncbi:hypothetical protein FGG08_003698 [Glutinoglossum americanum]|uniref:Uncharacterized protein n=1 Tax=Glutinoglossum americanum TaxID=1670608 RepID=A0A9P8IAM3_9PEZI|nr:hypothetical protein FGG08_003698 [Glutinoglossum americanum]
MIAPLLLLTLAVPTSLAANSTTANPTTPGDPVAATDLYGLGVRVGFYLQGFGASMLLFRPQKDSGRGIKLACGGVALSVIVAWTILAARGQLSPCEAFIGLWIVASVALPAQLTFFNPDSIVGEGVGLLISTVLQLWSLVAGLWMACDLVKTLPLLGTANVVFFFAKVSLLGWYRTLSIVLFSITLSYMIFWAWYMAKLGKVVMRCYLDGETEMTEKERKGVQFIPERLLPQVTSEQSTAAGAYVGTIGLISGLTSWVFCVVSVEKTIVWNNLQPSTDLSSPGQLIPFIVGATIALDGILFLCRPSKDGRSGPRARDGGWAAVPN